jgi:hypothetical protein
VPVQIVQMPEGELTKWANKLPNVAKEWAEPLDARGIPASEFLSQYLSGLRARGEQPVRAWDE